MMWRGGRACGETARALRGYVYARTIHTCCRAAIALGVVKIEGHLYTDHLARIQAGSPPGRRVRSATVETPSANPVVQFNCGIIRIYSIERLLPGIVTSDLMSTTGYLGRHYICGG
jgi:hypothetical protein